MDALPKAPQNWGRTPVADFQTRLALLISQSDLFHPGGPPGIGGVTLGEQGLHRGDPVITIALLAVVPTCI